MSIAVYNVKHITRNSYQFRTIIGIKLVLKSFERKLSILKY